MVTADCIQEGPWTSKEHFLIVLYPHVIYVPKNSQRFDLFKAFSSLFPTHYPYTSSFCILQHGAIESIPLCILTLWNRQSQEPDSFKDIHHELKAKVMYKQKLD